MSGPRPLRVLGLAVVLGVMAALSGCAGVPTSGPIQQGAAVDVQGGNQFIRVIARPPVDGMSPEDLVRSFLTASQSADNDYAVARDYLTPAAAAAWRPAAGVQISDDGGVQIKALGETVAVTGQLQGSIGPDGSYSLAAPGAKIASSYNVTRVDGQWRIASLPDGLTLARADVQRGFRTYNLYFLDPALSVLAPDPVTTPVVGDGLATALVRALLSGPTDWLAPAVRTAFPEGTSLSLGSVPLDNGIAQVDLTQEVLGADDRTRRALSAQLTWTLTQLPDVSGVQITVSGQPLTISGVGPIQNAASWSAFDPDRVAAPPDAFAVVGGDLAHIGQGGDARALPRSRTRPRLVAPVPSLDGTTLAALSPDRTQLWTLPSNGAGSATRRLVGVGLGRPSWDRTGALWTVDVDRGVIAVVNGKAVGVPLVGLGSGTAALDVLSIAIARDGTRAALRVQQGAHREVWVARVERDAGVLRLAAPRRVLDIDIDASDLAWLNADTLVVLGVDGASARQIYSVPVGLRAMVVQPVPTGAEQLAAAPGVPVLVTAGGKIFGSNLGVWTPVALGTDPSYPG